MANKKSDKKPDVQKKMLKNILNEVKIEEQAVVVQQINNK